MALSKSADVKPTSGLIDAGNKWECISMRGNWATSSFGVRTTGAAQAAMAVPNDPRRKVRRESKAAS
jgi:hypothetical protein